MEHRRILRFFYFLPISVLFLSCLPKITVQASSRDEAAFSFETNFSDETAHILRTLSGISADAPIFSKNDIASILHSAGVQNSSVNFPSATEIAASGALQSISKNQLFQSGIVESLPNSLTLTLGAQQFNALYAVLDETTQAYFDLMMIPALIGEKMTVGEYQDLLASVYGPTFARELTESPLAITLRSPDGTKQKTETVPLGDILTLQTKKSWRLDW